MHGIDHADDAHSPRVFLIKVARGPMVNNNYLIVDPATRKIVDIITQQEAGQ